MIVIDHSEFLSTRFDLVVRCYFLEKTRFGIRKAAALACSDQYGYLRDVLGELLEADAARHARVVRNLRKTPRKGYGLHVANRLFHSANWSSMQASIMKGEELIKRFPYPVGYGGPGLAAKRFVLSLLYRRKLYWRFTRWNPRSNAIRPDLNLWKEKEHERLLEQDKYNDLVGTKKRMLRGMRRLEYFSVDTYMGDKRLLERYLNEKGLQIWKNDCLPYAP